jgi:hypothetical protein
MDIAKSNSLITCGKVKFISLTLRNWASWWFDHDCSDSVR